MCRCVRAGYHQTRQPVVPVGQVPSLLQACTSTTAFEEGRSRQRITSELQADIQLADVVEDPGEIGADTSSTTSVQLRQVQWVPVSIQDWSLDRNCTTGSPRRCLHVSRRQADHCVNRSGSVRCIRHYRPLAVDWASTVSVRRDRCSTRLAMLLPLRLCTICQDRPASVRHCSAERQCSARIGTRPTVVVGPLLVAAAILNLRSELTLVTRPFCSISNLYSYHILSFIWQLSYWVCGKFNSACQSRWIIW